MKTPAECAKEMNLIMQYYGFPPIEVGTPLTEYMPRLLDFIEYLHGYAKEFVSTDSMR
jgi:hypothetical protein